MVGGVMNFNEHVVSSPGDRSSDKSLSLLNNLIEVSF